MKCPFVPPSDHKPVCCAFITKRRDKQARKEWFRDLLAVPVNWARRVPANWLPISRRAYQTKIRNRLADTTPALEEFSEVMVSAAKDTTKWPQDETQKTLRALYQNLRKATCPLLRKAYQTLLNAQTTKRRRDLELKQLTKWAAGREWGFGRHPRFRQNLKLPHRLNDDPDRANWTRILEEHFGRQFGAPPLEESRAGLSLRHLQAKARESPEVIRCDPNEIRDLAMALKAHKSGGQDGVGTNLLRHLPFEAFVYLAKHFEKLANQTGSVQDLRPQGWSVALVILIAKTPLADSADQFRPIALLAQVNKLYTRWLMLFLQGDFEAAQIHAQYGFRRHRQASEVSHTALRIRERAYEWEQPWSFYKIDVARAFDSISHHCVLDCLGEVCANKKATFALGRELVGGSLRLMLHGMQTKDIEQTKGVKQGAPESGPLFTLTLSQKLFPLQEKWRREGKGIRLNASTKLAALLFADDILLFAASVAQNIQMLSELIPVLEGIGLTINPSKLQIMSSAPIPEKVLGKNVNREGMEVLGRLITPRESTDVDIERKLAKALRKFMCYKVVLTQKTNLQHRLRLLRSIVLSVALWGAETWTPTKRRLSRLRGFHLSLLRPLITRPPIPEGDPIHPKIHHDRQCLRLCSIHGHMILDELFLQKNIIDGPDM